MLDGLELYYDGIENSGEGKHDNNTLIWKDLSGNGHDGTLNNFGTSSISGWHNNYLSFDGVNDWVNCGEQNYANVTLEAAYVNKSESNKELFCNFDMGGNGIVIEEGVYKSNVYNNGEYKLINSNMKVKKDELITQSMTYNGEKGTTYLNGKTIGNIEVNGDIGYPIKNTVMAIRRKSDWFRVTMFNIRCRCIFSKNI